MLFVGIAPRTKPSGKSGKGGSIEQKKSTKEIQPIPLDQNALKIVATVKADAKLAYTAEIMEILQNLEGQVIDEDEDEDNPPTLSAKELMAIVRGYYLSMQAPTSVGFPRVKWLRGSLPKVEVTDEDATEPTIITDDMKEWEIIDQRTSLKTPTPPGVLDMEDILHKLIVYQQVI
ncbi:MAG: hypothetical protein Q9226_008271 [Calogaya cf. arnoldii]